MTVSEKVAYLKGLADGLGIKDSTNEGKLMLAVIDVLEAMADDIEAVDAHAKDLSDSISDISEDMEYLEDLCIGDMDDDDYEDADEDDDQDEYDFGSETLYEVKCPTCGEVITIDEEMLDEGATTCPKCGETITVYEEDLDFGSIRCPKCDAELEFDMSPDDKDK